MLIISARDHENKDEKETKKTTTKRQKRARGDKRYSEMVSAKWFCFAFNLGFLYLISQACFIFKSILELALLTILKKRELYESKYASVEWRCLKI